MVTLDEFIGAVLSGIARGRAQSDQMSAQVAAEYAKHDLLKGFPIPRMTIGSIDVEVTFAVAPQAGSTSALSDLEVQKNATYRLHQLLHDLEAETRLHPFIGKGTKGSTAWKAGLTGVAARLGTVVASPNAGMDEVVKRLSVTVTNYLYECASDEGRAHLFTPAKTTKGAPTATAKLESFLADRIRAALAPVLPAASRTGADGKPPINVLVTPAELERVNPASLQKAKFTITSSDRRWVTSEKDGAKTITLDRA